MRRNSERESSRGLGDAVIRRVCPCGAQLAADRGRSGTLPPNENKAAPGTMTYCCAIKVDDGLVFAGDTRTSAGVDDVRTYNKLHVFEQAGDRVFVVLSAGNL